MRDGGREPPGGDIALVLAGGGARGAYEAGALAELLPALEARGERPTILVGTGVGALNVAWLGANAQLDAGELTRGAVELWSTLRWEDVLAPLPSLGDAARLGRYLAAFAGIRGARVDRLLDPTPLPATVRRLVRLDRLDRNVGNGVLRAAAVVATSAATARSVVFHAGGEPPAADDRRGIDYVPARLRRAHVLAAAAIPGLFPAVRVEQPRSAKGWYVDGGTRLNTPVKPALALGCKRVVVIAPDRAGAAAAGPPPPRRPDVFEGAGLLLQAVLADPLAHDLQTLAHVNGLVGAGTAARGHQRIPYVLVAPEARDTLGRIAHEVFAARHGGHRPLLPHDVDALGAAVGGGADAAHGELLSYLFFDPDFAAALIAQGRRDARAWLDAPHDDGPWQHGRRAPTG
ncbi:MAG TPA: patatin-like phospholipase family protein [Solirubrobacteraceae bacterium]|nr:patatin-like phospholipase family protein [Solirubrobacteraceae bacterium]